MEAIEALALEKMTELYGIIGGQSEVELRMGGQKLSERCYFLSDNQNEDDEVDEEMQHAQNLVHLGRGMLKFLCANGGV